MSEDKRRILELAAKHVCPGRVKVFGDFGIDLVIGKREGHYIWDIDGKKLIDLHLNGGVYSLGHRNPELMEALGEALQTLDIGNHHFPSVQRSLLAERLAELTPGDLTYTVFASSGSEANDIAIKTARRATRRRKIVSFEKGYYGRTGLSGAVGGNQSARFFLSDEPSEHYLRIPFNDLSAVERALSGNDVAAVILETIPATAGFLMPEEGYLAAVKALCEKHGAVYIADEVQTGLARTGRLWGVERYGVQPDILVTGKGLSGGLYPIAATILNEEVAGWLTEDGYAHVSTFGGAELGCAVAIKVLEICNRPEVLANVSEISERFGRGLSGIQGRNPFLKEIRRCGLVMALGFDHEIGGILMMQALYRNGIWAFFAGYDLSVIQFKPGILSDGPLCDEILERFEKALSEASGAL